MPKQKQANEPYSAGVSEVERLRLRVSAMINSPRAQAECRVSIWRLDSDTEQVWRQVIEELAETDGLSMSMNSDGTLLLEWEAAVEDAGMVAEEVAPDLVVQRLHEEPAPF
ncbi:DUF1654 domain-containing protein [Pseudomonas denitrificans (nom. rej.)]|uniref:DUF1654 domain-containing protein n=1 Tax=Pseudomonas denitrificans TaxID=43306 RepID=A0A9X7R6Z3_PSEDE|nr:DUF1654 domain-containing protein [Pseudomonas denitrificans (nom. rej.)]QEY75128.1 DUF1654 domain-containing protein [Pseudomonas denitrificans (nom. rej.)]